MESKGSSTAVINSLPWERHEVVQITDGTDAPVLGMFDFLFKYSRFDPQIYKLISAALWPFSSAESSQRRGVSCERHSACDSSLRHSAGISFLQRDVFDLFLLSFQQGFVIFQTDGSVIMENGILRTVVSKDGTLASLHLIAANR